MKTISTDVVSLLRYDPADGAMYWKTRQSHQVNCPEMLDHWNRKYAGKRAGSSNSDGYEVIRVGGNQFRTNRLVWELLHGPIPNGMQIDHVNGDRRDNRAANLRAVTITENNRNMRLSHRNTSGLHGVVFLRRYSRFQATIVVDRKHIHLGYHQTLIDAAAARKSAEFRHGFHPNHGR